jgi:hypothetical protein
LKIADAVADAEEYTLALSLCELAKSSAQKARQYPLVKELAAKIEEFRKRQRAVQEYQDQSSTRALAASQDARRSSGRRHPRTPRAPRTAGLQERDEFLASRH